jgi:hypothetical protein
MSKIIKNVLSLRAMTHIKLAITLITPPSPYHNSLANCVPPIAALTPCCLPSAKDVASSPNT